VATVNLMMFNMWRKKVAALELRVKALEDKLNVSNETKEVEIVRDELATPRKTRNKIKE